MKPKKLKLSTLGLKVSLSCSNERKDRRGGKSLDTFGLVICAFDCEVLKTHRNNTN